MELRYEWTAPHGLRVVTYVDTETKTARGWMTLRGERPVDVITSLAVTGRPLTPAEKWLVLRAANPAAHPVDLIWGPGEAAKAAAAPRPNFPPPPAAEGAP